MGKKTKQKKTIHRRKFKKNNKKNNIHKLYRPMCVCTKVYTKGTVYSSVKAKAVTSGQEVDNKGAQITMLILCIAEFLE